MPNSFFEAMLSARVNALEAAREAMLVGDDESEGALGFGGGGKEVLALSLDGRGECCIRKSFGNAISDRGDGGILRSVNGR